MEDNIKELVEDKHAVRVMGKMLSLFSLEKEQEAFMDYFMRTEKLQDLSSCAGFVKKHEHCFGIQTFPIGLLYDLCEMYVNSELVFKKEEQQCQLFMSSNTGLICDNCGKHESEH